MLVGLPVVLPLLALYASRKREEIAREAALMELKDAWQGTARQMQQQEAAQVQQVGQALQQLREDLQKQLPSGKLKAIESKLAALEGSVLSAGRSAQSAARTLDAAGSQMADAAAARMDKIGQELLRDMQQGLLSNASAPLKQLSKLDAQLEDIQGNLDMLQQNQTENVRQLAQELVAAVEDSENQLQRALQMEARRSAENFQRLPALLAAALPVTDVTALQMLPENVNTLSRQRQTSQLAPADRAWLQALLENAMQQAADRVLEAQSRKDARAIPAVMAEEQWEALGRRLRGIEVSLQAMAESEAAALEARDFEAQPSADLEDLQSDIRAALAAAQEAQSSGPVLQDSLAKVTTLLETLVSQEDRRGRPGEEEAVGALLEELRGASSELGRARAALEDAVQQSASSAPESDVPTGAVQDAARTAALEVLRELQQQGSLGGASSLGSPANGNGTSGGPAVNGVPKGYKGDPSDSRADAFRKMQELLKAQDSTAAGQQGAQQTADTSQPSTDDLVPISAWLGQQSEPMDRRIAEEALLAGVDYSSEEAQSSFGASSGAGLAPGAAEGLTSAPVQSQPVSADSGSSQPRDLQPARGSQQQESVRSGESFRSSSSQESRPGAAGSAPQGQDAYSNPGFEIAVASGLEPSDGGLQDRESRDPASEQETYREDAGGAESGAWEGDVSAEEELAGLLEEGKALLRRGRELSRGGYDYGEADAALQDAMACFEEASALDPASTKVLGNWGNALMAYGTLKKRYLSALQEGPQPYSYEEQDAASLAEQQITSEAEAALVAAGQKFLAVVEQSPEDCRALGNWGNALCLRAELAQDPEASPFQYVACTLYEAAVAKYEAVLEMDPQNRAILRNCAFALYDLGRLQPDPASRTARQLLEDAARYFQDVLMLSGEDDDVAAALDTCMADLEDVRAML